jgi:hypothetical protein
LIEWLIDLVDWLVRCLPARLVACSLVLLRDCKQAFIVICVRDCMDAMITFLILRLCIRIALVRSSTAFGPRPFCSLGPLLLAVSVLDHPNLHVVGYLFACMNFGRCLHVCLQVIGLLRRLPVGSAQSLCRSRSDRSPRPL